MLWALLGMYLFGVGGGPVVGVLGPAEIKQISQQVKAVVVDPARREAALDTLSNSRSTSKGFEKAFSKSGKGLKSLYRDHEADTQPMVAILEALNEDWHQAQQRALELRFELREQLTEEEWALIFGPEGENPM